VFNPTTCWIFFSVNTQKDVVGITRHVVPTISAFSFTMLLLDRILTHIVNHLSNTSYHFQYLYYPGGNETGAKPNLITCITEIFLSVPHRQGENKKDLIEKIESMEQDYSTTHCKENSIYVFTEGKLRGLVPNFYIHISVSDL
jgi:hypothetical protein